MFMVKCINFRDGQLYTDIINIFSFQKDVSIILTKIIKFINIIFKNELLSLIIFMRST